VAARAPLIAVAGIRLHPGQVKGWRQGAFAAPQSYLAALQRAGLTPVIVPDGRIASEEVLARFEGLLLLGGGDLEPHRYGADRHPGLTGEDAARDEGEIASIRAADRLGLPTFAICRGIQVMNVAFGGTLLQHIPDVHGSVDHGSGSGGEDAVHGVKVAEGSRLAAATRALELTCRSNHHQALDALGPGLTPVAWSVEDGLVEGVEREEGWMLGVQWHPERSAADDPAQQALFDGFADAIFGRDGS
jgi:putative glutamine amidotransferase